eukprot:Lankesteria_metandrocarpae@DN1800_c0_g1_i1.p2
MAPPLHNTTVAQTIIVQHYRCTLLLHSTTVVHYYYCTALPLYTTTIAQRYRCTIPLLHSHDHRDVMHGFYQSVMGQGKSVDHALPCPTTPRGLDKARRRNAEG